MLEHLPFVEIPGYLTQIMLENSNESKKAFYAVQSMMTEDRFFQVLIHRTFKDQKINDLQKLFHSIGLRSFRNQLSAVFFEFYEKGRYSFTPDLSYIQDVISFEDRFEEYGTAGSNRVFMLGIFLKFADAGLQSSGMFSADELINPPAELEQILSKGISHQEDIDFLILLVWQLLEIWPEGELSKRLHAVAGDFSKILISLDEVDKKKIANTILVYSASIKIDSMLTRHLKV